jgi:hypothetical protein
MTHSIVIIFLSKSHFENFSAFVTLLGSYIPFKNFFESCLALFSPLMLEYLNNDLYLLILVDGVTPSSSSICSTRL